jgi:hypothetical protein
LAFKFELFLENRDQEIGANGDPDLGFDSIFGLPEEDLDMKILLNPFEKQLYLPPLLV